MTQYMVEQRKFLLKRERRIIKQEIKTIGLNSFKRSQRGNAFRFEMGKIVFTIILLSFGLNP